MATKVTKVNVYHAKIEDKPGGLAAKLKALSAGGANLEFVVARRAPDKPGKGVVFVAPLQGAKQLKAARAAGFKAGGSPSIRVQLPDRKGLGTRMTGALAEAGINLQGVSAASIGKEAVVYLRFGSATDANKAMKILKKLK
jgi:hypothetical protein